MKIYQEAYFSSKSYNFDAKYMAFSPTNSICAPISVEHARKQSLSTTLDIRFKLSCSQALCAHVRADYARARILYTMMQSGDIAINLNENFAVIEFLVAIRPEKCFCGQVM